MMSKKAFSQLLEKYPYGVPKLSRNKVKAAARCFMYDEGGDEAYVMLVAFFVELADHYMITTGGIDGEYERIFTRWKNK